MMRKVTMAFAAALAIVLLPQDTPGAEATQKARKGQTQNHHFGRGVDIAAVDGQPAGSKAKTKKVRAAKPSGKANGLKNAGKGRTPVSGEVFVKLPRAR